MEEDEWVTLEDSLANISCDVAQSIEVETHSIIIGTVKRVSLRKPVRYPG